MIVFALLLQAAPAAPAPAPPRPAVTRASAQPPDRFSILLPDCPAATGRDVVVCGDNQAAQRLPLPGDAEPTPGYVKPDSGDYRDNAGNDGAPCAARMGGCQVGFGPPIVPMIAAGVRGVGNALANGRESRARRRDGDRRQPIDLAADKPVGRLEP